MYNSDESADRWFSIETGSLTKRLNALLQVATSDSSTHELRSTIGTKPVFGPYGDHHHVELELYKIWYVLHYGEEGQERTTTIHSRKIGKTVTDVDKITAGCIYAALLPIENGDWDSTENDRLVTTTTEDGDA